MTESVFLYIKTAILYTITKYREQITEVGYDRNGFNKYSKRNNRSKISKIHLIKKELEKVPFVVILNKPNQVLILDKLIFLCYNKYITREQLAGNAEKDNQWIINSVQHTRKSKGP